MVGRLAHQARLFTRNPCRKRSQRVSALAGLGFVAGQRAKLGPSSTRLTSGLTAGPVITPEALPDLVTDGPASGPQLGTTALWSRRV
jgi:hypothetical protein